MSTSTPVRLATSGDLDGIAEALSLSFEDDPVMGWLFGDQPPRPMRYTRPFFATEGRRHLQHDTVYTADGHPGAAYWDPPGHWKTSPLGVLRLAPLMVRGMGRRTNDAA